MSLSQAEVSALEFIFKSKYKLLNRRIGADDCLLILKQIFNRREYKGIIQEASQLLLSSSSNGDNDHIDCVEGTMFLNSTKFVALIEMMHLREQHQDFNITISIHYMLEKLRLQCLVDSGDYVEAGKIQEHIELLLESESSRRRNILTTKQSNAMNSLKRAHEEQYVSFKEEWKNYFADFEIKAKESLDAMKEQHILSLEKYLEKLEIEAQSKTPLWSKDLKQFKKREKILAYQENYGEAQKVKVIVDVLEKDEKEKAMVARRDGTIARKESSFRQKQEAEVRVLLKRIRFQRETNKKKYDLDCKRLLQRNRNIQESLKSKQTIESHKKFENITKDIQEDIEKWKSSMQSNPC